MNGLIDLVAYNNILKTKVNTLLSAELSRIKKLLFAHNVNISAKAVFGKTKNVVQRLVTKYKFDLVVSGNQGMNYNKSLLFGSTSEKLIHYVKLLN